MALDSVDNLRVMIKEALAAYGLARSALANQTRRATQDVTGEHARSGDFLYLARETEANARLLLEKASLAHLMGAPSNWSDNPAQKRPANEMVAVAFAEAQIALIDLRKSLLHLALAAQENKHPDFASKTLGALAETSDAPFANDARESLTAAYQSLLIQEINAGRVQSVVSRVADLMGHSATLGAALQALVNVLPIAIAEKHHEAAAFIAVALAPKQFISPAQRRILATQPECQIVIRKMPSFRKLHSRSLRPEHATESDYYLSLGKIGNPHVSLDQHSNLAVVAFEAVSVPKDGKLAYPMNGYFDVCLEMFDFISGQKVEQWSTCLRGVKNFDWYCRYETMAPGTSKHSLRHVDFTENIRQVQLTLNNGSHIGLDRELRVAKTLSDPWVSERAHTFITDLPPAERESLLWATNHVKADASTRGAMSADGLYAVIVEENGKLHTLARSLDKST